MTIKKINLEDEQPGLDELLQQLSMEGEILLTRGSQPLALLSSVAQPASSVPVRIPGLHAGTTWTSDDFDDPLPDAFWFGG